MHNKSQRLWQLDLSRNDDLALALVLSAGARPLRGRLSEILISSFFAGLAGVAFSFQPVSYYPSSVFSSGPWTFDPVLTVFIGGVGTLIGPVIGAFFYIVVREQLAITLASLHPIILGIMSILIVLVFPGGLVDISKRLRRLGQRRGSL